MAAITYVRRELAIYSSTLDFDDFRSKLLANLMLLAHTNFLHKPDPKSRRNPPTKQT